MITNRICPALFCLIFLLILIQGCTDKKRTEVAAKGDFIIRDFDPLVNWKIDSSGNTATGFTELKSINLDYTGAIGNGFIIPTVRQTESGTFRFGFDIRNTGKTPARFFYKIYYQNESYKFPETDPSDSSRQHIYADENFYGSWEDATTGFIPTGSVSPDNDFHHVEGEFRIVGNPRNEKRYYSEKNDRWKRNPRVGKYSFMLVVTKEDQISSIPGYISDISQMKENRFVNPYYYFLHGPGKSLAGTVAIKSLTQLSVIARPDPGAGIYIPPDLAKKSESTKYFCATCGSDTSISARAAFEQFINYVDPGTKFSNIPVITDVMSDNYTLTDYNWNRQFFTKEELVSVTAMTTRQPCQTVTSDPATHTITMKNPGCTYGNWEKQNVGIITRHGFTYGKWTIKAKLTELLNRNGMWNGLTNAIWLLTQSQDTWNYRRICAKEGYMETYWGGPNDKRVPAVGYSEIDFEILKTVPYCPSWVLPPVYNNGVPDQSNIASWNVPYPEEISDNPGEIQVACTNWDMACWEPRDFAEGCTAVKYGEETFWAHRWDRNYRALTEKVPASDDELFGSEYFYFQIDWQPDKIIWRIGPSKDRLRVVGYEDHTMTSIPNNQMLMIVTQEYHNTKWWVGSPYSQDNIPFPEKDLTGIIYELTIE